MRMEISNLNQKKQELDRQLQSAQTNQKHQEMLNNQLESQN